MASVVRIAELFLEQVLNGDIEIAAQALLAAADNVSSDCGYDHLDDLLRSNSLVLWSNALEASKHRIHNAIEERRVSGDQAIGAYSTVHLIVLAYVGSFKNEDEPKALAGMGTLLLEQEQRRVHNTWSLPPSE